MWSGTWAAHRNSNLMLWIQDEMLICLAASSVSSALGLGFTKPSLVDGWMNEEIKQWVNELVDKREVSEWGAGMSSYIHLKLGSLLWQNMSKMPFLRPGEGKTMQPSLCAVYMIQLYKMKTTEGILKTWSLWLTRQVSYRLLCQESPHRTLNACCEVNLSQSSVGLGGSPSWVTGALFIIALYITVSCC